MPAPEPTSNNPESKTGASEGCPDRQARWLPVDSINVNLPELAVTISPDEWRGFQVILAEPPRVIPELVRLMHARHERESLPVILTLGSGGLR